MELAPFPPALVLQSSAGQVVKASSGHHPLPFWIRIVKNWRKDTRGKSTFPNLVFILTGWHTFLRQHVIVQALTLPNKPL
jgi:hypothetical protein